jgi:hypothetical protein
MTSGPGGTGSGRRFLGLGPEVWEPLRCLLWDTLFAVLCLAAFAACHRMADWLAVSREPLVPLFLGITTVSGTLIFVIRAVHDAWTLWQALGRR